MKLSVISVTEGERARGALDQSALHAAITALHEEGAVILRGLFPTEMIDGLHREFTSRNPGNLAAMEAQSTRPPPNPVQKVGDARFEFAMRMTGPFGSPELFANKLLLNFIGPLLGGPLLRLGSMTAVASFPGAALQHIHRDHPQLFKEFGNIGPALPLYAINVSIPLIDVDPGIGPTAIWPGTHRQASDDPPPDGMISIPFLRGDCILMDYRTLHTGLPNNSQTVRPILYLVYTREWFFDDNNHRNRAPLDMPLEDILALPEDIGMLMLRARLHALRARQLSGLPIPA